MQKAQKTNRGIVRKDTAFVNPSGKFRVVQDNAERSRSVSPLKTVNPLNECRLPDYSSQEPFRALVLGQAC